MDVSTYAKYETRDSDRKYEPILTEYERALTDEGNFTENTPRTYSTENITEIRII